MATFVESVVQLGVVLVGIGIIVLARTYCCTGERKKDEDEVQAIIPYDPVYV